MPKFDAGKFNSFKVLFIDNNGVVYEMPAEVDGDKVIFTTDHFSCYTIVGLNVMAPNTPDTPDVENNNTMVIVAVGVVVIGVVVFFAFWFSEKRKIR